MAYLFFLNLKSQNQKDGKVIIEYDTEIYYNQLT